MQANAGVKSVVNFYDEYMGAIEFSSKERHMYITTHTSHFNLAETWPGVYWGTLGATSLESLNFDFYLLQDQTFMLATKHGPQDIDFKEYVSIGVQGWPTPKACPSVQLVGLMSASPEGLIEES
jgi:hypothetical protein